MPPLETTATTLPCPAPATTSGEIIARLLNANAQTPAPLPIAIRRLLPSLSWLSDTPDAAIQFPDEVAALAHRIEVAMDEVQAMQVPADPAEVVVFLSMMAERRGMALPSPSLLAMDARAIAAATTADLWPVACARLWSSFAYRRLPECSDFLASVADELAERRDAVAKIQTVHLKVRHLRWLAEKQRECTARHAAEKARERERYAENNAGNLTNVGMRVCVSASGVRSPDPHEDPTNPPCDPDIGSTGVDQTTSIGDTAAHSTARTESATSDAPTQMVEQCSLPFPLDGDAIPSVSGHLAIALDSVLGWAGFGIARLGQGTAHGSNTHLNIGGDTLDILTGHSSLSVPNDFGVVQLALGSAVGTVVALQGMPERRLADAELVVGVPDGQPSASQVVDPQHFSVSKCPGTTRSRSTNASRITSAIRLPSHGAVRDHPARGLRAVLCHHRRYPGAARFDHAGKTSRPKCLLCQSSVTLSAVVPCRDQARAVPVVTGLFRLPSPRVPGTRGRRRL
jgi:hypothetical protein